MEESSENPNVWDRLPEETDLQYMAFMCYLELESPNIEAAYRSYYQKRFPERWQQAIDSGEESKLKAAGSFHEWSKIHLWKERRQAYYDDLYEVVLEQLRNRQITTMLEHADLGRQLRETAQQALDAISSTTMYVALSEEDGREIWILESNLKPHEIAKLAELGVTIENKVFGKPDSIQEHNHNVNPDTMKDIDKIASNIKDRSEKYVDAYEQMQKNLAELGIGTNDNHSKN